MRFFKGCISVFFTLLFFGAGIMFGIEQLGTYLVVNPKLERITEDLGTYVEANDRPLSDQALQEYAEHLVESGLVNSGSNLSITYRQLAYDRRFNIEVGLDGKFLGAPVPTQYYTWNGVVYESPEEGIYSSYREY